MKSGLILLLMTVLLAGCASKDKERIILMPDKEGKVGHLDVRTSKGEKELSSAWATASIKAGEVVPGQSSREEVADRFGSVIEGLPPRPQRIELNFELGSDRLTAQSRNQVPGIQRLMKEYPAPEVIVIGHTDALGDAVYNDRLSLERARRVVELLVEAGVPRDAIQAVGRGSREPLIPTKPGAAEPRNRRVVIKVR